MRLTSSLSYGSVAIACCLLACSVGSYDDEDEIVALESDLTSADSTLSAELRMQSQWPGGYCASVTMKNVSASPITSWRVVVALNGSTLGNAWNVTTTPSGGQFTAVPLSWNATLGAGASTEWGFCGNGNGTPTIASVSGSGSSGSTSTSSSSASNSASSSASSGAGGAGGGGGAGGSGGAGGAGGSGGAGGGGGTPGGSSGLPVPPGSGNVPRPSGAPGNLVVLDWAGFRGAVSYTFDDSNSSQIQNYDALNALGVPFTFYLQTGKSESNNPVWQRAVRDGHELGNHTKSHLNNDNGSDTDAATRFIEEKFGVKVWTMAAPYGSSVYANIARTRFLINRGVANALIGPNDATDPFNLPCYIPPSGASTAMLDEQVRSARSAGKWRTVLVHGFTGGNDGAYQPIPLRAFLDHVQNTKALGDVWIDSVVNIGAYWRGQKVLSSVTPTTSGSDRTWRWTLPANFPPGKYLRVRVDGGTLKQNGVPLTWDPHGYYEVALDAGSLTLSP